MKLTKKLQAEVLKVYKAYWDAYFSGDMKTFASFLDENIWVFGTAVSEVFHNKKKMLRFYKATAEQLVGKAEFRNRRINVQAINDSVLINEQCDLYILMEEKWTFYGNARASAILKHTRSGWKLVHQHGSFPDTRAEEGEQLAAEKIKAENIQLRDAVKRRTIELEEKNRELEIEFALERVRAKTNAMHRSEDLHKVIREVHDQLRLLEFRFDGVDFMTDYSDRGFNIWLAAQQHTFSAPIYVPVFGHKIFRVLKKVKKDKRDFFAFTLDREEKNKYIKHLIENTIVKNVPEEMKHHMLAAKGWATSCVALENIILSITNLELIPYTDAENTIIKRFAHVFQQSYTRFLDLQKAEAQTREAQIQLALERVRARAMAMYHSDELSDVVKLLYQEFDKLKIGNESTDIEIGLINEETGIASVWAHFYLSDGTISTFKLPLTYVEEINNEFNIWKATPVEKRNELFLTTVFSGDLSARFMRITEDFTDLAEIFRPLIEAKIEKWVTHNAYFSHGFLTLQGIEAYSTETQEIQRRFAKVFEQTYTRFLDLQKAEAQAREAQIEAALERVRSRTMAMQKTNELLDAAELVHKELGALGINSMNVSYAFVDEEQKYGSYYSINPVDGRILPIPFVFPHTETEVMRSILASWKKQESYNVIELKEKATLKHQTYIGEHIQQQLAKNNVPFSIEEFLQVSPKKAVISTFNFANGYLFNIGGERLSKIQEELMLRFTRVFEQTYTRFLDLQKAEAQAREAQIEAALERVRSRTMGMQKSEELKEVIQVVYEQFVHLNVHVEHTGFIMDYKARDDMNIWLADKHAVPFQVTFPYFDCAHWNSFKEAKEKGIDFFANHLSFEEKNKFYRDLFKLIPGVPEETLEYYFSCPGLAISTVLLENVGLYIENFSGIPYTDDENKTLLRFGKVFQQTYTRFLDLQKAEAQAREAKIEAALEKVRSRSLAMHKSDELHEIVKVVFEKLNGLEIGSDGKITIALTIFNESQKELNFWAASEDFSKTIGLLVPYHDDPIINGLWNAKESGAGYYAQVYDFEEKNRYWKWALENTNNKFLPEDRKKLLLESETYAQAIAIAKQSGIYVHSHSGNLLAQNEIEILIRFAKVFDQSYTRFLDLQKAEAQAREAEIELGLERVRARAMAMQKSDELKELIGTVAAELTKLDLVLDRCFIAIFDPVTKGCTWWMAAPETPSGLMGLFMKYHEAPPYLASLQAWEERQVKWQYILEGPVKKQWDDFVFSETEFSMLPPEAIDNMKAQKKVFLNASYNAFGCLSLATLEQLTEEQFEIMVRFAKVFDLTYTRFNDLKQAEAQAREAQIELGLERVRARAMAMQKSDELSELVDTVFKELTKLDFALTWCIINIIDEPSLSNTVWAANPDINKVPESYHMLFEDYPFHHAMMKGWKERKTKDVYVLEGQEKKVYDEYLFNETEFRRVPAAAQAASRAMEKYVVTFTFSNFGGLQTVGDVPLSDANLDILSRFGKVFDLTYTRFNDLKQAEAQARESQIQLALERVRARTMAMQKSEELGEVSHVMNEQMQQLNLKNYIAGFLMDYNNSDDIEVWRSDPASLLLNKTRLPYFDHPIFNEFIKAKEKSLDFHTLSLTFEEKNKWVDYALPYFPALPQEIKDTLYSGAGYATSVAYMKNVGVFMENFDGIPFSEEENIILKRFAKVFEQTYTRFLDLQKSEAQTRESQIQLALERVRARTMAMQKSDELPETSFLLFQQVKELGETTVQNSIGIVNEETGFVELSTTIQGHHLPHTLHVPIDDPYVMAKAVAAWKAKRRSLKLEFEGQELKNYNEHRNSFFETKVNFPEDRWIVNIIFFSKGWLSFSCDKNISDETVELLKRFAAVFEQTYIRFNDLKQAEEQAREAQIEAALERVRARAMAMHTSEDLAATVSLFFSQLNTLQVTPHRCGVSLVEESSRVAVFTATSATEEGLVKEMTGKLTLTGHPVLNTAFESWKKQIEYHPVLQGEEIRKYYQVMNPEVQFPDFSNDIIQFGHYFSFREGFVFAWTEKQLKEEELQIFRKFTSVLSLTYRRYKDLKEAEAQAREAQIETALERVRSRTLAMHKSEELAETAVVLFKQMIGLGIEPNRLYIAIINDDSGDLEFWITDENGEKVSSRYMVNIHKNISIKKMYEGWAAKKKTITIDMQGKELEDWLNYWKEEFHVPFKPGAALKRRVQNIAYFSKGFVAIASPDDQPESTTNLLQRFAAVFNLTYTRFSDLKIAEAHALQAEEDLVKLHTEKRKTEEALAVLQATQKQLIQSEKMASLGELTAGIAHEIQNPLNFVNNFSEVSNELIEELKIKNEKLKIEDEEVNELLNDISQNLEKINHHGKRADAIVKGMLQHSRTSSGQKVPTDINVLAEEYLRLAYHGLRAKDKSFNAKFETDFDPTINKIDLVQQDIGRVMLNLINNAFYAVDEKKRQAQNGYDPIVTINTKKLDDTIEITVKDNGNGIPKKVLDKIFQPFFTTKPTGQGTGLGLSLAYDIIKTHGGELKVDTEEGKGANFIISIPIIDKR